jgi:hypothetical protein
MPLAIVVYIFRPSTYEHTFLCAKHTIGSVDPPEYLQHAPSNTICPEHLLLLLLRMFKYPDFERDFNILTIITPEMNQTTRMVQNSNLW